MRGEFITIKVFLCVCVLQFHSLPLSKVILWNLQTLESASWTIRRLKRVVQLYKIRLELHSWFRGYRAAPIWTLTRAASLLSLSKLSQWRDLLPALFAVSPLRQAESSYILFINLGRGLSDLFAEMLGQISWQSSGRGSHAKPQLQSHTPPPSLLFFSPFHRVPALSAAAVLVPPPPRTGKFLSLFLSETFDCGVRWKDRALSILNHDIRADSVQHKEAKKSDSHTCICPLWENWPSKAYQMQHKKSSHVVHSCWKLFFLGKP